MKIRKAIALVLVVAIVLAAGSVFAGQNNGYDRARKNYESFQNLAVRVSNIIKKLFALYDYVNVLNINEQNFEGLPYPPAPQIPADEEEVPM